MEKEKCEWCDEYLPVMEQPLLGTLHIQIDQCLDETEGMIHVIHEMQNAGKTEESVAYLEKVQENLLTLLLMSTVSPPASVTSENVCPTFENEDDDDEDEDFCEEDLEDDEEGDDDDEDEEEDEGEEEDEESDDESDVDIN